MLWRTALVLVAALALAAPAGAAKVAIDDDPVLGDEEAPLVLVEFGDLQCPACYGYATKTLPAVKKAYVDTGKVRLVYLDFPLDIHASAFDAAVAAQCAGRQGKFWQYHDEIFQHLRYTRDDFVRYAGSLALDGDAFTTCLDDPEVAAGIHEDVKQARALGVNSTPSFVLARPRPGKDKLQVLEKIRGAQSFETFKAALDAHLDDD